MFVTFAVRKGPLGHFILLGLIASLLIPSAAHCASSVTLAWDPSLPADDVTSYRLYSGIASRAYTTSVTVPGTSTTATVSGLETGNIYYFAVTAVNDFGFESDYSTEVSFTNSVISDPSANQTPTLNAIAGRNVNENSGAQTVALSGISAGPGENQPLTVNATSSNPALIPHPTVNYNSPNNTGSLTFQPVSYQYGFATISVTVSDGQSQNNSFTRTFNVVVNDRPFISAIYDQALLPGASLPPIAFSISDTETPVASLVLSATSSVQSLLPDTNIVFFSTNAQRFVSLTPVAGQTGTSTVSVAVSDGLAVSTTTFRFVVAQDVVNPVTGAPHISGLTNLVMETGTTAGPIPFTVWDEETPAENLTLEASSTVSSLVPNSAVTFGGAGTNRTLSVTPVAGQSGQTTIAITVSDGGTVATASFQVTVLADPQSTVQIVSIGQGSVVGTYGSQPITVGSTYTVTALPAPGQVFTGWTGSRLSSNARLTFTAQPGMELKANFASVDSARGPAQFNGLFREENKVEHETSGFFALKTTSKGSYSGSVRIGKSRYSLKGSFGSNYAQATNACTLPDGRLLRVEFSVIESASRVLGRITDGSWEAPLLAHRHGFELPGKPDFSGVYTLAIPSQNLPNNPGGHGYATVRVNPKGMARFAGKMADGTKVSQSATLSIDGKWPFHASLYSKAGSMLSWMTFANAAETDISGTLHWTKPKTSRGLYPQGFTLSATAFGSRLLPNRPALPPETQIVFGGALSNPIIETLTLDQRGRYVPTDKSRLAFKFSPKTGLFSGKLSDPASGAKWKFTGAVLQKQQTGYGFTQGIDQTGPVLLMH